MLSITYISEIVGELTLVSMCGQLWALPFFIYFNVTDLSKVNKWTLWLVTTLLIGFPSGRCPDILSLYSVPISDLKLIKLSSSDPGTTGMELPKFQQRTIPNSVGRVLQCVCTGWWAHRCEYLPRGYVDPPQALQDTKTDIPAA